MGVIITFIEEHDSLDGVFCKAHLLLQSQQQSISIQMRMGGWRKYGRESQLFKVYLGKFLKMWNPNKSKFILKGILMATETSGAIDSTKIYHFIKAQGQEESSEGHQL